MKLQTGVRIEAEVWQAYRIVCGREKLRPSQPIEGFLRLVLENDSALGLMRLIQEAVKSRVGGYEAYARVLLDWYTHGKFWIRREPEDISVESLLLDALKIVVDKDLRSQIEVALVSRQRNVEAEEKAKEAENYKSD